MKIPIKWKRKSSAPGPGGISTFLGPDALFEGTLTFTGIVWLDGQLKGKIRSSEGTVIIGERARIEADVRVARAIIKGEFHGTIEATEQIEVFPPGYVTGEICSPVIAIDPGAVFNGNCGMKKSSSSPEGKKRPPEKINIQEPDKKSNILQKTFDKR